MGEITIAGHGVGCAAASWHAVCNALTDLDVSKAGKAVGNGTAGLSRQRMAQRSSYGDRNRVATFLDVIARVIERISAAGYVAGDFNK